MKFNLKRYFAVISFALLFTLGSCSAFKKGCNCPKFGQNQPAEKESTHTVSTEAIISAN